MKPSNTLLALLCAFSMAFVSCENNDPDTKKGGDTPTSQHQPSDPASWSPVGHRYAAPYDGDDYGFYVYQFFSKDSVLAYQTIKSDYSLDEEYQYAFKHSRSYSMDYPTLTIISSVEQTKFTFKDTTQFFLGVKENDFIYTLID